MVMIKVTLLKMKCKECKHRWFPRQEKVFACPKCKSNNIFLENVLGKDEEIEIICKEKSEKIKAKIDTGADTCSMDEDLAIKLGLSLTRKGKVKTPDRKTNRLYVKADIVIIGKRMRDVEFNIKKRKKMKYNVIIGKNVLRKKFLIYILK